MIFCKNEGIPLIFEGRKPRILLFSLKQTFFDRQRCSSKNFPAFSQIDSTNAFDNLFPTKSPSVPGMQDFTVLVQEILTQ